MNAIVQNHSIAKYTTFGVPAKTAGFLQVNSLEELHTALTQNPFGKLRVLGGGSNMLWTQDFDGLTLQIAIRGITIIAEDEQTVTVNIGAGENWHEFVLWTLKHNYGGVENLALIPGNVGAAPIQNIGAYGVELKDCFLSCDAIEIRNGHIQTFSHTACAFSYRESVFKKELKGQFIITAVQLQLQKPPHHINSSYGRLSDELQGQDASIQNIAAAVIRIRSSKLPDPKVLGNCGSFFKNPIIPKEHYEELLQEFEQLPHYPVNATHVKIPAAWLIDALGFKGHRIGDAGVHESQPLVLVNHGNALGKEIVELAEEIKTTVQKKFNIYLEEEVNIY